MVRSLHRDGRFFLRERYFLAPFGGEGGALGLVLLRRDGAFELVGVGRVVDAVGFSNGVVGGSLSVEIPEDEAPLGVLGGDFGSLVGRSGGGLGLESLEEGGADEPGC